MSEDPGQFKPEPKLSGKFWTPEICGACRERFDFSAQRDYTDSFAVARCFNCGAPYVAFKADDSSKIYVWHPLWKEGDLKMASHYSIRMEELGFKGHRAWAGEFDRSINLSTGETKSGDTWDEIIRWREFKEAWKP